MRNKIVLGVIILAVILGAVGFWYFQRNSYSKGNVKLDILGPTQANVGDEVEYTVTYKNNGNITLEQPQLTFEYPDYSIVSDGKPIRQDLVLQSIYPGQEKSFSFKARLMGTAGSIKTARAWLSYKIKGLTTTYESDTTQTTQIQNVPLTLDLNLPSSVEAGKQVTFNVNYFSNVDYPLSDVAVKMQYPDGFQFQSSSPSSLDSTEWDVGALNKAQGGRIEITGIITGNLQEDKVFTAQLGVWQNGTFVPLQETNTSVTIANPSLYISQTVNGSPQYVASPGDTLHYEIFFKNIGTAAFNNLFLVAKLNGNEFDLNSIKAPSGAFNLGDNSIIFDWRNNPDLQLLNAQQEGKVEFWVNLKNSWASTTGSGSSPTISDSVYLSQAEQEFTNKVNTKLDVSQKAYYSDEVFGNSGPTPPKVGQPTTYTVTWQASDYYNDVKNVQVKATLGPGVTMTGKIFPDGSNLTYDSVSKQVVWKLDSITAGQGVSGSGPNVSFQVSLTPTVSQVGTTPTIIGVPEISGEDQFTGQTVKYTGSAAINTTLPDDSTVSAAQGVVQ